MYGCFDGAIVYGWFGNDRRAMISKEWLEAYDIEHFAADVVRFHGGDLVYGLCCSFNETTGQATISDERKERVQDAAKAAGIPLSELKFHITMFGDYELEHTPFVPVVKKRKSNVAGKSPVDGAADASDKEEDEEEDSDEGTKEK
jgi:hypothetical protein